MPAWTFAAGPWGSLPSTELPTITGRSVTWRLIGNSEAAFTIDGRLPEAASVHELISDLRVYRDSVTVFRGRVGASNDSVSADSHTVAFSAADYRALLVRQILYDSDTLTYTSTTDAAIVTALINIVQARSNGNLGITVVVNGSPNTLASTVFPAGQSVGEAIATLSNGNPGFDWDITSVTGSTALTLNLWYPQRGVDQGRVVDYPGRIQSFTRAADPGTFANTVRASGGTGPAPVTVTSAGIATDPAGRWDMQIGDTSMLTSGMVTGFGQRQLALAQYVAPAWVVTLNPNDWGGPSDMWLGDPITISAQTGRLNAVVSLRIYEIQLALDDASDTATATLTLGAPKTDRRWRIRNVNRRLVALERR